VKFAFFSRDASARVACLLEAGSREALEGDVIISFDNT
jgi:hypothetical protein